MSQEEADLADVLFSLDIDDICSAIAPDDRLKDFIGGSWRAEFTDRKTKWFQREPSEY